MKKAVSLLFLLTACYCVAGIDLNPSTCSEPEPGDLNEALQNSTSNVQYNLLHGEHCVNAFSLVRDLRNITFQGPQDGVADITCTNGNGLAFFNVSQLHFSRVTIHGCGIQRDNISSFLDMIQVTIDNFFVVSDDTDQYVAMMLAQCNDFTMEHSSVTNTRGLGLLGINVGGESTLNNVTFQENVPDGCFGPVNFTIDKVGGGAAFYYHDYHQFDNQSNHLEITDSNFARNSYCGFSLFYETYSPYERNRGNNNLDLILGAGGGLSLVLTQLDYEIDINVTDTTFTNNTSLYGSGAHLQLFTGVPNSVISFDRCLFQSNGVDAALSSSRSYGIVGSALALYKDLVQPNFTLNRIDERFKPSKLNVRNSKFRNNTAYAGTIMVFSLFNLVVFSNTEDNVLFADCIFEYNIALWGAGILFEEWKNNPIQFGTNALLYNVNFSHNVLNSGPVTASTQRSTIGIVVVDAMNVTIAGNSVISHNIGTGIAVVSTNINLHDNVTFFNNTGSYGGGISLLGVALMVVNVNTTVNFLNNTAAIGGAIYADLYSSVGSGYESLDCFLYFSPISVTCNPLFGANCGNITDINTLIRFEGNKATQGNMIYGSTLNLCPWSRDYRRKYAPGMDDINLLEILYTMQNSTPMPPFYFDRAPDSVSAVSTIATHVNVSQPGTDERLDQSVPIDVAPGLIHRLNVSTYDGFNQLVPTLVTSLSLSTNVTTRVSDTNYGFLPYSINSSNLTDFVVFGDINQSDIVVTLLAVATRAQVTLKVNIVDCPDGYNLTTEPTGRYKCECHPNLLIIDQPFSCTDDSQIIVPFGRWFGRSDEGELLYGFCPQDYCRPIISVIPVNSTSNTSEVYDMQCNSGYNRSGLACGRCKEGYSVVFGSNKCLQCSNSHLWLLVLFAVYGVLLMWFIVFFRFTIAEGYLNGVLFFSNILTIYVPYTSGPDFSVLYVVFFWLSLKMGIEACFYDGMTGLASVTLQFVFPLYLYFLLLVIVLVSRWSSRFSRWLGKQQTNPAQLFATVMVMTYASLLETCIDILSFTNLRSVESNKVSYHWGYDQTVYYFQGYHLPLGLFAILLLLFFLIPAPFIWMFPSVVSYFSRLQRFKPLYDAVWAPLKPRFRFWVSLRLLLRAIPLVIVNFFPIPTNLLLLCFFLLALLFIHGVVQPFEGWGRNAVDSLLQTELLSIALTSLYFSALTLKENTRISDVESAEKSNDAIKATDATQDAILVLSILYVYATLTAIFVYHFFLRFPKLKYFAVSIWNKLTCKRCRTKQEKAHAKPTTTVVAIDTPLPSYGSTNSDEDRNEVKRAADIIEARRPTPTTFTELREPLLESSGLVELYQVNNN